MHCFIVYLDIFVIGLLLANFIKTTFITKIGLGFLLGSFYVTFTFFLLNLMFSFSFTQNNLEILLIVSTIVFTIVNGTKTVKSFKDSVGNMTPKYFVLVDKLIVLTVLILSISSIAHNLFWPVTSWDSITLYDFRGKVLASQGYFTPQIAEEYFLNYPPYTSLLHMITYLSGSSFPLIWYSFLYISSLLVFYSLTNNSRGTRGLWGVLVLALSPQFFEHSLIAYTNLPYAIFVGLGIAFLWSWVKESRNSYFTLGIVLSAISSWVRTNDPFVFVSVLVVIIGTIKYKKSIFYVLISLLAIAAVQIPWVLFKSINIPSDSIASGIPYITYINKILPALFQPTYFIEVSLYLIKAIFPTIGILSVLAAICIYYDFKKERLISITYMVSLLVIVAIVSVGTVILRITYDWWNDIPDSITRLSMVANPLLVYIIINSKIWGFTKKIDNIKSFKWTCLTKKQT